jgi:nucleoside-diphosphate-sugar epimerase
MKQVWLLLFLVMVVSGYAEVEPKSALVCGAGGFIGHHLVKRYKQEGYWVRGVDIKYPEFEETAADEFILADLRNVAQAERVVAFGDGFNEVCQLAANMGGMGFISSHDAEIMHDSALINLNVLEACRKLGAKKIFFSSSACAYPLRNQLDPLSPKCSEDSAYPADPDTEYGWEKLFSERLYQAYARDYGMDTRIARFHNIFGPLGTWKGGREKAPAALCRKIAEVPDGGTIQIWGSGDQTRSFLYIDECVEGIRKILSADPGLPVLNLGSEEMISINDLAYLIASVSGKQVEIENVVGPEGVRGRNSDNQLILQTLNWCPAQNLKSGIAKLYPWIEQQVREAQSADD